MARTRFIHQLDELNHEMTHMGMLCETIISRSMKSLFDHDLELAASIPELLDQINQDNQNVEAAAMQILLRQQPVASDLRQVSGAMKIVTDMRRIGIQGADIAEIVTMDTIHRLPKNVPLKEMAQETTSMVSESVDAFVKRDDQKARAVISRDDIVDGFFNQVKTGIIGDLQDPDREQAAAAIDILMIAKYLERIADHAVHISRWVCYVVTGKKYEG